MFVLAAAPAAAAPRVEITPFGGWQFGGGWNSNPAPDSPPDVVGGDVDLPAAVNFGLTIDYTLYPGGQLELVYNRQPTRLTVKSGNFGVAATLFDVDVEYWHLGGLYEVPMGARTRAYANATVGATHFNPVPAERSGEWRFSFAVGGGGKLFLTDRIGLRAQGRLWFTFLDTDSAWFCTSGGGCLVNVDGTIMTQAEASAGLILAF